MDPIRSKRTQDSLEETRPLIRLRLEPCNETLRVAIEDRIQACLQTRSTFLDLSGLNLTSLPERLKLCRFLKEINLQGNPALEDTNILSDLPDLEKIITDTKGRVEVKCSEAFLRLHGTNEQIIHYLGLDTWNNFLTSADANLSIINCFRKRNLKLDLSGSGLSSLPPQLHRFTWLKTLSIQNNSITNLSPICALSNLTYLNARSNKTLSDISCLKNMTSLKKLNLSATNVSDLSALSHLQELTELKIAETFFNSLKPIEKIPFLDTLVLSGCCKGSPIDLSPLNNIKWLKNLNLAHVSIFPSFTLSAVDELETLDLSFSKGIEDLTFLKNKHKLKNLKLDYSNVSSLSGLENMPLLQKISLKNTEISDLSPIGKLTSLQYVYTNKSAVRDYTPLANLFHLSHPRYPLIITNHQGSLWHPMPIQRLQGAAFPGSFLKHLDLTPLTSNCNAFEPFLKRIIGQDPNVPMKSWNLINERLSYAKKCVEIIEYALQDEKFREDFFTCVTRAMGSCSDRTVYYLNKMAEKMDFHKTKELSITDALSTFEKYHGKRLAREFATKSALNRGLTHEEIEVRLDFYKELHNKLSFPMPFSTTSYTDLHWLKAPEEEISTALTKIESLLQNQSNLPQDHPYLWFNYLSLNPFWQRRLLQKNPELQAVLDQIAEEKAEKAADLPLTENSLKEHHFLYNRKIAAALLPYTRNLVLSTTVNSLEFN